MRKQSLIIFCIGLIFSICLHPHKQIYAQVSGGQNAFSYLQLPFGAHVSGLGGITPTFIEKQNEMLRQNPALLQKYHHNHLTVSYSQWVHSIKNTNLQYSYHLPNLQTNFSLGLQYLDYGLMNETNLYGEILGQFKPNDYTIYLSASRKYLKRWDYGATIKWGFSNLGSQSAIATLVDVGINYHSEDTLWQVGIVAKNMGFMLKKYANDQRAEPLPFDLQIGIAKRLENLPLTIFASAHHLYSWDIRYNNPLDKMDNIFEEESEKEKSHFADKLFRHLNFGAQLHIGQRIHLNVGYSHLRRKELANEFSMGLSGFNLGLNIRLHKFHLGYALVTHSIAGPIHEFGLNIKLSDYFSLGSKTQSWHWQQ